MNVYLAENSKKALPGDLILQWIARSDLVPMPRTIEMTIKNKDGIDKILVEGANFWSGYENLKYSIINVNKKRPTGLIQNESELSAFTVYAVLDSCKEICFRRSKPIVKENTNLGEMYRACGAQVTIANDVNINHFACFKGDVPSFSVARVLQEHAVTLTYKNNQINVVRLNDLMSQKPIQVIGQSDTSNNVSSKFLEYHQIPSFYSLNADGSFVYGNFDNTRAIQFIPRKTENELHNMTRVLVTRKVIDSNLCQQVFAGDIITVIDKNYVVITAAHVFTETNGAKETTSKFWVGDLSV